MAGANTADFFGEGTADQGTAAPLTLAEQSRLEDARLSRRRQESTAHANASQPYRATRAATDQDSILSSNNLVQDQRIAAGHDPLKGDQEGFWKNLSQDPITAGILAAPYAVLGAGAVAGGLAAGGVGSIATPAGASPYVGAAAGVPAMGAPASMASPFAAGAPGAAGAAGSLPGTAGAAAAAAPGAWTAKDYLQTFLPLASSLGLAGLDELMHGGQSAADKALLEKQDQMAREAEVRREQTNTARMDALGQRMLAYNPHNQLMAQMFGPDAAFAPTQFADMVANPMKPAMDPSLYDYSGTDPKKLQEINDFMGERERYAANEAQRRDQMMTGMSPVPQGPQPMQMPTPQAARRY